MSCAGPCVPRHRGIIRGEQRADAEGKKCSKFSMQEQKTADAVLRRIFMDIFARRLKTSRFFPLSISNHFLPPSFSARTVDRRSTLFLFRAAAGFISNHPAGNVELAVWQRAKKSVEHRCEVARSSTEDLVKKAKEVLCGLPKNAPRVQACLFSKKKRKRPALAAPLLFFLGFPLRP